MQSLRKRLEPIKNQVLTDYKVGGAGLCYEKGYYRDYVAFDRWLREVKGSESNKDALRVSYGSVQGLLDRAIQTFIETVVNLKATNEELRRENQYLRSQLRMTDHAHADALLSLVEVCKEDNIIASRG